MRNIILFDAAEVRENLLPMTFTRPVPDLRVGILTIREKWERVLESAYSYLTVDYLQEKYPTIVADDNIFVAGNICPTELLVAGIMALNPLSAASEARHFLASRSAWVRNPIRMRIWQIGFFLDLQKANVRIFPSH